MRTKYKLNTVPFFTSESLLRIVEARLSKRILQKDIVIYIARESFAPKLNNTGLGNRPMFGRD